MKKNLILGAASLLLAFSAASAAAQTDAYGVYLGAGVSMSKRSSAYTPPEGASDVSGKYQLAFPGRLFAGYAFTENWAVEAGRTVFLREKFSMDSPLGRADLDTRGSALYVAGKYSLKLDEKWRAFGKVGIGRTALRVKGNALSNPINGKITHDGMYYGAGVDYAVTPNAGVVVEYENVNKMKADGGHVGAVSVSGRYSF